VKAVGYFLEGARRNGARRSIGEQNRAFLEYCQREGYEVAGTFLDMQSSGGDFGAGFRQMLDFLHRNDRGFTVVVVDAIGALGPELGQAAMRMLAIESAGARAISAHTGKDVARDIIDTWADRGEGTPVSERVRSAMRRKAVRGEVLGRPPYGYRVGPRQRLEVVPDEALVVRYIFRLYLQEDLGIRRIAGQLNAEGIPTRRGGRWSMVTVRDILRNRAYLGTYTRFGVKVPNSHPALVSPDDFRAVQERMQSRHHGERSRTVVPFLLSGLVYCARCGNRLIGVSRRQRWKTKAGDARENAYRYYQCESRTNQSACGYNTQRAPELEARVRSLLADDGATAKVVRAGNVDSYLLDLMAQVERVEQRIRKNRRELEELVADAAHGHISLERMKALGAHYAEEHQALEDELVEARARVAAGQTEAERRKHLEILRHGLVVTPWDTIDFTELQTALRDVIDRIEVDGDDCRVFLRA
jgi:site-specific DNA recombinase